MYKFVKIRKDGNSPILTLSNDILKESGMQIGDRVLIENVAGGIKIKPAPLRISPEGTIDELKIDGD